MPQCLVVNRVGSDGVAVAGSILHGNRTRRTGDHRQVRIPNSEAAYIMRADVANLCHPAFPKFTLEGHIPLLRVRRVGL